MSNREKIVKVLQAVTDNPALPDDEDSLFDAGYLDSFALTELVSELEKEFGIRIPDSDLNPGKFESIARIEAYIANKLG
jgi:D-alanine--poly(phosphoribitol) ligase subunit 2